jgi:dTMP kinase
VSVLVKKISSRSLSRNSCDRFPKGYFITFEGGEGCGKSTQIALLSDYLNTLQIQHITTREPGGCPLSEKIRGLLMRKAMSPWTETFLVMAARWEHWEKAIQPALQKKHWVLCDRFSDSTLAYQGYGRGLPLEVLMGLVPGTSALQEPDLTLLLTMDVKASFQRKSVEEWNRFEKEKDVGFHQRVAQGYFQLSLKYPDRIYPVDADGSIKDVHHRILEIVRQKFFL